MKFICSHIHHDISKGIQREYFVYFVPRRAVVCEKVSLFVNIKGKLLLDLVWYAFLINNCMQSWQILEEEKIHHLLTIGEYPLYLIPLDEDVLSFELDVAYKVRLFLTVWSKEKLF